MRATVTSVDDFNHLIRSARELRDTTREYRAECDALWHEIGTASISDHAARDLTRRVTQQRQAETGAHARYLRREFDIIARSLRPGQS